MKIHFRSERLREEKELAQELKQAEALDVLGFESKSGSRTVPSGELKSSKLEEVPYPQIEAEAGGLLGRPADDHDKAKHLETLRHWMAEAETPLGNEFESTLNTLPDTPVIQLPLPGQPNFESSKTGPANLPKTLPSIEIKKKVWKIRTSAVVVAICLTGFTTGFFSLSVSTQTDLTTEQAANSMPTVVFPKNESPEMIVTSLEPFVIDIPKFYRSKTNAKIKPGKRKILAQDKKETTKKTVQTERIGFLNVHAKPWAKITIDGEKLAHITPQTGIKLTAGFHRVRVKNPNSMVERTVWVEILKGRFKTLTFDLLEE